MRTPDAMCKRCKLPARKLGLPWLSCGDRLPVWWVDWGRPLYPNSVLCPRCFRQERG